MSTLNAKSLPVLIGSLPLDSHLRAVEQIFEYTPQIPLWPQLPVNRNEGMLLQFLPGLPGVVNREGKVFVDTDSVDFETELLAFYEDYLAVMDGAADIDQSRFRMGAEEGNGVFTFLRFAEEFRDHLTALKGQVTGPVTFSTSLVDQAGRAVFYNDKLRDACVKHLALKARWQARQMAKIKQNPLIFFDEPGLAGLGSSAFITITPEDITACLSEVFEAVHSEGGLVGVHVCANTEWSVIFDSGTDIVSFDAYSYFDKFILYPDHIRSFFERGGICASGIVPTTPESIEMEDVASLAQKWFEQSAQLEKIGIPARTVYE
ncbi:MAG: hypothetical protein V2I35_11155, partial [Desulfocapsaceae bacterium]|nr:hypothetical protein [Desulfocapsaceae bacterium]